jgi:hypothetical protein
MARKLYVYDDEARRQLENRGFAREYQRNRAKYINQARRLYRMLANQPARPPLKADIQGLLAEYLYVDADFTALILKLVKTLETRHQMWCGTFAAMVVDDAWDAIIAE